MKFSISFGSPKLEKRFETIDLTNRSILPGKPIVGKYFQQCGALKLFQDLGLESFLIDLPKVYYSDLVREFYGNLHEDKFGNCVSMVRDKKIRLNPSVLNSILKIDDMSEVDVFTSKGFISLPEFTAVEQLQTLFGPIKVMDLSPPTTTQVTPLAHLLFMVCRNNLCPRAGNRSNFTCQDVVVVSMIMARKAFDLSHLILQNMIAAVNQTKSGLPYGLMLSKVFEFYKIDVKNAAKVNVKEVIDVKNLTMSNLQVKNGELVRILPPPPESPVIGEPSSVGASPSVPLMLKTLLDDNVLLI